MEIRIFYNSPCLKCGRIDKEMIITGALIFCNDCFPTEFKSDYPAKKERENYLKWLRKGEDIL